MASIETIQETVVGLADIYGFKTNPLVNKLWASKLQKYSDDEIFEAVQLITDTKTRDYGWKPVPADVVKAIEDIRERKKPSVRVAGYTLLPDGRAVVSRVENGVTKNETFSKEAADALIASSSKTQKVMGYIAEKSRKEGMSQNEADSFIDSMKNRGLIASPAAQEKQRAIGPSDISPKLNGDSTAKDVLFVMAEEIFGD